MGHWGVFLIQPPWAIGLSRVRTWGRGLQAELMERKEMIACILLPDVCRLSVGIFALRNVPPRASSRPGISEAFVDLPPGRWRSPDGDSTTKSAYSLSIALWETGNHRPSSSLFLKSTAESRAEPLAWYGGGLSSVLDSLPEEAEMEMDVEIQ